MSALVRALAWACAGLALLSAEARAHEFWLRPSPLVALGGDTISVRAFVGENLAGDPVPYRPARVRRLEAVAAAVRDLAPAAVAGADPWVRFVLLISGGTQVVYDSEFASIELEAEKFDEYLRMEGLDSALAARRASAGAGAPGRERYRRSVKAWIRPPRDTAPPPALGLELEVVALAPPRAGSPLDAEVRFRGKPLGGALVRAWREGESAPAPARQVRAGTDGRVTLAALEPGVWLVHVVHMIPCSEREAADWESYWAAWTFEVPPARP